ncbi:unnamed protein product [[Actinomadura] parvosata subsp. kistnae]|nr:unnamed protein product [Actinomadura parvosata subsp. kistnae]
MERRSPATQEQVDREVFDRDIAGHLGHLRRLDEQALEDR